MNQFGEWLTQELDARLGPGWRRRDAADFIGVKTDNTIGNWLGEHTPKIDLANVYLIADAFGIAAAEVVEIHERSLGAELPKGQTATTTRTRQRRMRKLSEMEPRPGTGRL